MPVASGPPLQWAPLVAFGAVGVLALVLRWAWSGRKDSLLSTPSKPGSEHDYGLLVPVAAPRDADTGRRLADELDRSGIRNTLTTTHSGLRLMVFPVDAERARAALGRETE